MYMVVPCDIYSGTGMGFNVIGDTLGIKLVVRLWLE